MSVQQLQRPHFIFAYNSCDSRQREFEFFRLRGRRQKQPALRRARAHRFRRQLDLYDGSAGWVRIQIKLQELEKNFGVQQGDR